MENIAPTQGLTGKLGVEPLRWTNSCLHVPSTWLWFPHMCNGWLPGCLIGWGRWLWKFVWCRGVGWLNIHQPSSTNTLTKTLSYTFLSSKRNAPPLWRCCVTHPQRPCPKWSQIAKCGSPDLDNFHGWTLISPLQPPLHPSSQQNLIVYTVYITISCTGTAAYCCLDQSLSWDRRIQPVQQLHTITQ